MTVPSVWGEGALFAFSGMDGETDWAHPFIGTALTDRRGFEFQPHPGLRIYFAARSGRKLRDGSEGAEFQRLDDFVMAGDMVLCDIAVSDRHRVVLRCLCLDHSTMIGEVSAANLRSPLEVMLVLQAPDAAVQVGASSGLVLELSRESSAHRELTGKAWLALVGDGAEAKRNRAGHIVGRKLSEQGDRLRFAWAYSTVGAEDALARAKRGLATDVNAIYQERLGYFKEAPDPKTNSEQLARTFAKCLAVMKVNCMSAQGAIRRPWTTPDRWPHSHMWLWDSAFHVLGLRHVSAQWAQDAILAVLDQVHPDGFLPLTLMPEGEGPQVTQPPILAWATWRVYEKTGDRAFLQQAYPGLRSYLLYDLGNLDRNGSGLCEWKTGGESGMDNSPRFDNDGAVDAVDLNCQLVSDVGYLSKIADALGMPQESGEYQQRAQSLATLINKRMWDPASGFYYDLKADGQLLKLKTLAGFYPLFAGVCDQAQADALAGHLRNEAEFWTPMPVPSVAVDEPSCSDDMWRGPTWVNCNYLIIEGLRRYGYDALADELTERTLRGIAEWYDRDGVIYEFYDPQKITSPSQLHRKGKVGTCIRDYHWTAAVFVDLMMTRNKPQADE